MGTRGVRLRCLLLLVFEVEDEREENGWLGDFVNSS